MMQIHRAGASGCGQFAELNHLDGHNLNIANAGNITFADRFDNGAHSNSARFVFCAGTNQRQKFFLE